MRTYTLLPHKTVLPLIGRAARLLLAALALIHAGSLAAQPVGYCSGLPDNYACPEEPVKPDPALLALITGQNASNPCFGTLQFDNFPGQATCANVPIPANAFFIHQLTFPPGAGNVPGAVLQFRAKAAPAGQTSTDFIAFFEGATYITGASLRQLAAAGGTWNPNQDATFTLALNNLPAVFGVGNIMSYLNDGDLDVVIGNETGVDWMCIDIQSPGCVCGGFSQLFARPVVGGQSIPLTCGGPVVNFGCPKPGFSIPITGKFECIGSNCPPTTVTWTLTQPGGATVTGTVGAGPYFYLPILPKHYAKQGSYTLALRGSCNGQPCTTCVVKFSVACPIICPCDVANFQKRVANGFATARWNNSCKTSFAPIALDDCDAVAWSINSGPVIATTNGNASFSHTFSGSGVNTVTMTVTRSKDDNSDCGTFSHTKSVAITCGTWPDCNQSLLTNPRFSTGAKSGALGNGGTSEGWTSLSGEPFVLEGQPAGTLDGWSVFLSGNLDTADVLSSASAVCIGKETGTVSLRLAGDPIPGRDIKVGRVPPNGIIYVDYYSGNNFTPHNCTSCYRLAALDILPLDTGEWVQIEIPFNLSDWTAFDSCGDGSAGIPLRIAVHVSSPIGDEQGEQARYIAELDNLCVDGSLVSVKNPAAPLPLRLYPNPTSGTFTLELPAPALPGTHFRITDLTGRLVLEQAATDGSDRQLVGTGDLPAGLYFVQAASQGQVIGVARFVKQ
ncbi:MAG: T9SS type A sorting domain-containing protein [Saprospiraceae bacterium]